MAALSVTGAPAVHAAPPGPVTDLAVSAVVSTGLGASSATVTLSWTAPDDGEGAGLSGGGFLIRYSSWRAIGDDAVFDSASFAVELATTAGLGELQTYAIDFLDASATHYFAVKSTDSAGEISTLSTGATAPSYIIEVFGSTGNSHGAAWADIDGDGDLDAVVANSGSLEPELLILNQGGGVLSTAAIAGTGSNTRALAWCDLDNDGDLDAVLAESGDEHILRNDGAGAFTRLTLSGSGGDSWSVACGDLDNDGDMDAMIGNDGGEDEYWIRNDGDLSFTTITLQTTVGDTYGLALGDYDADGDLDALFGNYNNQSEVLATNLGSGVFSTSSLGTSGFTYGVAWADYDGDGDLDAMLADGVGGTVKKLQNNGNGAFSLIGIGGTEGNARGVAWGDFDADGDPDAAIANYNDEKEYILRNEGSGTFTKLVLPGTDHRTNGVSWGDFDDDGDLDLLASHDDGTSEEVFRNDLVAAHAQPAAPSGSFAASFAEYSEFSSSGVVSLSWPDGSDAQTTDPDQLNYFVRLTTDGVSGGSTTLKIPPRFSTDGRTGGGSFLFSTWLSSSPRQRGTKSVLQKETTVYWAVVTEDYEFNRSAESTEQVARLAAPAAVTDLAVTAVVSTGLGASEQSVTLSWTAPGDDGSATSIANGEFEIRWWSDAGVASTTAFAGAPAANRVSISTSVNPGEFQTATVQGVDARATNYFLITTKDAFGVRSWVSNPATAPARVIHLAGSGGNSEGIAWGDYDGDGDLDLAVNNLAQDGYILRNDGGGIFTKLTQTGTGGSAYGLAWADHDRDGDLDLFIGNNGVEAILSNAGSVPFTKIALTDVSGGGRGKIAVGDYDNDGDLDIATAEGTGVEVTVMRNEGGVSYSSIAVACTFCNYAAAVAWGDEDGDGDLDLAVGINEVNAVRNTLVLRNDGGDSFTEIDIAGSGGSTLGLAWGDYDGDGDLDLAAAESRRNAVSAPEDELILRNDGDHSFTVIPLTGSGGQTQGIAWGDLDGDGDLDLAWANAGGDNAYVALNDGGSLSWFTIEQSSGDSHDLSLGDYDDDGDLDLAVSNFGEDAYLVRNDTLAASSPPTAPVSGFSAAFQEHSVFASSGIATFGWDAGSDAQTPASSLEYRVRFGTSSQGGEIIQMSSRSSPSGMSGSQLYSTRLSSATGQRGLILWVQKEATFYWAVAAEDAGFARSAESAEQQAAFAAPAAVSDLAVVTVSTGIGASSMTARLIWTAPGENGNAGAITNGAFEIRYSTFLPMTSTTAFVSEGATAVLIATSVNAGQTQTYEIPYLDAGTTHYFALTTKDRYGVRSWISNAATGYAAIVNLPYASGTRGLAWGDYDGDGDMDLLAGNNGDEHLYANDGAGGLTKSDLSAGGVNTMSVAWGDYDNDGDLDAALADSGSDSVLRNDGGGAFALAATLPGTGGVTRGLVWGDLDNDGDLDLVGIGEAQPVFVAVNDSWGSFSTFTIPLAGAGNGLGLADYDEDGDLDIGHSSGTSVGIIRNNGNLVFSTAAFSGLGNTGNGVAWGDFDTDGDPDLAAATAGGALNAVLRNDGNNAFTLGTIGATNRDTRGIAAGDFDDDGDLDLYAASAGGATDIFYENGGAGTFSERVLTGPDRDSYGVSWGDFDGDGDLDIAVGNDGTDDEFIYRNDFETARSSPAKVASGLNSSFSPYSTFATSGTLTLSWSDASDDSTPAQSMRYFVRVGTTVAGSSTTMKIPARFAYSGYGGQSAEPWSTRVSASQRGIKLVMQKETTVYWSVTPEDEQGARGDPSDEQTVYLTAPAGVSDLASAHVFDLASSSDPWVKLTFTAPGEDGNSGPLQSGSLYDIRWTTSGAIDTQQKYSGAAHKKLVDASLVAPGGTVNQYVSVMEYGRPVYFAMTTIDSFGVRSTLSNDTTGIILATLSEETTQAAQTTINQSTVAAFLHMKIWGSNGGINWTGLAVKKEGDIPDASFSRVAVYKDLNSNGVFDPSEKTATRSNPAVFASSRVVLTLNENIAAGATQSYFVGLQTDPTFLPVPGTTVALRLDGNAFTVRGGGVQGADFPGMMFDGVDDRVVSGFVNDLNVGGSAVTVEAWVKTTDGGVDRSILTRSDGDSGYRIWLNGDKSPSGKCGAGVPTFFVGTFSLCARDAAGNAVPVHDGHWHHVAAIFQTPKAQFFVDGVALSTRDFTGATLADVVNGLGVGGPNNWGGNYLDGELDEVRVSAFVRYPAELPPLRRNGDLGAQVLYHFDSFTGTATAVDSSGKGVQGDIQGLPLGYARSSYTFVTDIGDVLYSSAADITPDEMFRNQSNVPLMRLKLWAGNDTVILDQIVVSHAGSGGQGGVEDIKLFLDDGDDAFEPAVDTELLVVSNYSNEIATFNLTASGLAQTIAVATRTYFFAFKVGDAADFNQDLGITILSTAAFYISGSTDSVYAGNFPLASSTRTVRAAVADVMAETTTGSWVNTSSIVFLGNFAAFNLPNGNNVDHFTYRWNQSPADTVTTLDPQWGSGTAKTTTTATSDGPSWYFHALGVDQSNAAGTQQDFGPFWIDRTEPAGSAFLSYNSADSPIAEGSWNDLASGVTAQVSVQDAASGLNKDGPAPPAPSSGTISFWRFEDASSSLWLDGGPGRHGLTPEAALPDKVPGRFGTGLRFNGVQSIRNTASTGVPTGNAAFSIDAWIKPASTQAVFGLVSWREAGGGGDPTRFNLENGRLAGDLGGGSALVGPVLSTGVWQHVAMTFDGNTGRFYLDGAFVGQNAFGVHDASSGTLRIGRADNGNFYRGEMDEVRIFGLARSAEQIAADASRGDPYFVSYSTDAGYSWRVINTTAPESAARVELSAAQGSLALETLKVYGLDLVASTTTAAGGLGSNQIRFHAADIAGNVRVSGPYAVLSDTNTPISVSSPSLPGVGTYTGLEPDFHWTGIATASVQGMGGSYFLQVSSGDADFGTPNIRIAVSVPAAVADQTVAKVTGVYLSTFTLAEGTTYYWRVKSRSALGLDGPWGPSGTFVTDASSPAISSFIVYDSTGGVYLEGAPIDLQTQVTAQITVFDNLGGLAHPAELPVESGTAALWHFSEVDGTTPRDARGDPNNVGTFACPQGGCPSPRYDLTPFGAGIRCDGSEVVAFPNTNLNFAAKSSFTLEAWINPDSVSVGKQVIMGIGSANDIGAGTNFVFMLQNSQLFLTNNTTGGKIGPLGAVTAGKWQMVSAVVESGRATFYVDGRLNDSGGYGVNPNEGNSGAGSVPFSICAGVRPADSALETFYTGWIDEVRVSTFAKTAAQIAQAYSLTAPGRFGVEYSTNAGTQWNVVSATVATPGFPYAYLDGAPGATDARTLAIRDLTLAQSLNLAVDGTATNQVRFQVSDRSGNYLKSASYAIVVDTVAAAAVSTPTLPMNGVYVSSVTAFAWTGPSTPTIAAMGGSPVFQLQVDDDRAFNSPSISISTPVTAASQNQFFSQGSYLANDPLADNTTYYWRVRALDSLGVYSPDLTVHSFVTQFTTPTGGSFATFNSTGGAVAEALNVDLTSPVTVQVTVNAYGPAGLSTTPVAGIGRYGVVYTTQGASGAGNPANMDWIDGTWGAAGDMTLSFNDANVDGIKAFAVFNGELYAGAKDSPRVYAYNGTSWSQKGLLGGTTIASLAVFDGRLFAGLADDNDIYASGNGTSWVSTHTFGGPPFTINAMKEYLGQLYLATSDQGRIWAYDPVSGNWYISRQTNTECYSLEVHNGRLYAGCQPYVYVFDGATWNFYPSISVGVTALQSYNGILFAGSNNAGRVYKFNGEWEPVLGGTQLGVDRIVDLAAHSGRLYAVGGRDQLSRIFTYDGKDWLRVRTMGANTEDLYAAASFGERLYVGGRRDPSFGAIYVSTPIAATLSGTEGATTPETLKAFGLSLSQTGAGVSVCGQSSSCQSTNQVRFTFGDRGGNQKAAGPFAILVDTLLTQPTAYQPASGQFVNQGQPVFSWIEASTQPSHQIQVDPNPAFPGTPFIDQTTSYFALASPLTLSDHTTYYWRVKAVNGSGIESGYADAVSFVTDLTAPATGAMTYTTSTGAVLSEGFFTNLASGASAQLAVSETAPNSGLSVSGAPNLVQAGVWNFDLSTGALALDHSGAGNHATLTAPVVRTAGRRGLGLRIGASPSGGQYAETPSMALAGGTGFTIAAWVKPGLINASSATVWANPQARMQYSAVQGKVLYRVETNGGTGGCSLSSSRSYNSLTWTHVAFVMGTAQNRIYVDGKLDGSCGGAGTVANGAFRFGEDGFSGLGSTAALSGTLDEVRIYRVALTAAELASEAGANRFHVLTSTNAGQSWQGFGSTDTAASSFVSFSGSADSGFLVANNLQLTESTNTLLCGSVSPCGATNQIKFAVSDLAGNVRVAGPYAVLVDTSIPLPLITSVTPLTTDSIYVTAFATDNLSGLADYLYEASTSALFALPVTSSPWQVGSDYTFLNLAPASTYYIRVTARDYLNNVSTPAVSLATATFATIAYSTVSAVPVSALQDAEVPMLTFYLKKIQGQDTSLDAVTVERLGNSADADVSEVRVYQEFDSTPSFSGSDSFRAAAPFVSSKAVVNLLGAGQNVSVAGVSVSTIYVVYKMAPGAGVGNTVGARISISTAVALRHPAIAVGQFPTATSLIPITDGANTLTLQAVNAVAGDGKLAPGTTDYHVLTLLAQTDTGTSQISSITVRIRGSLPTSAVNDVNFWRDAGTLGVFEPQADVLLTNGADTFGGATQTTVEFDASDSLRTFDTNQLRIFMSVNLSGLAPQDTTAQFLIQSASEIFLDNSSDTVNLSGNPTAATMTVILSNTLTVQSQDEVPAAFTQGVETAVLRTTMTVDSGVANINRFTVDLVGGVDSDVEHAGIWFDQTADGAPLDTLVDILVGSAAFVSKRAVVDISTKTLFPGTSYAFFISLKVSPGANPGNELGVSIINSNGIGVGNAATTVSGPFPLQSSTATVQATVNSMILSSVVSEAPGSVDQGTAAVPMLRFTAVTDNNDFDWLGLTVTSTGTASDGDVVAVNLYRDFDANNAFDATIDSRVTSGADSFSGGTVNLAISQTVSTTPITYFVALDMANNATPGKTIGVLVSSTSSFNLFAPNVVSSAGVTFPLKGGPSPIQQFANTVSVTTSSIVPALGAEPGALNVSLMSLRLEADVSNADWLSLRVDQTGTAADADVAAVKLYFDINDIGNFNASNLSNYQLVSYSTNTFGDNGAASTVLYFSTPPVISPTPKRFFLVADLAAGAQPDRTVIARANTAGFFRPRAPNTMNPGTGFTSDALKINAPPATMFVVGLDSAAAQATQGDANRPMLTFQAWMSSYTADFTQLRVTHSGTSQEADIPFVKLYRDADEDGVLSVALDTRLSTASFSGGSAVLKFSTQTIRPSTKTFFLTYDFSTTAGAGGTTGARIGAAGDFKIAAPNTVDLAGFPMQSAETEIQATQAGLFVSGVNQAPGELIQAATDQILLNLTAITTVFAVSWDGLIVTASGTAAASDIKAVNLWKDVNQNGVVDPSVDEKITSGLNAFVNGSANMSLSPVQEIGTSQSRYLVTIDVADFAVPGRTFGVVLTSVSFSVTNPNFTVDSGFPIASDVNATTKKLAENLVVSLEDLVEGGVNQGVEAPYARIDARASRDKATWTALSVQQTGTLGTGEIVDARVYRDTDGSGSFTASDLLVGSGTFSGSIAQVAFSSAQTVAVSTQSYFVVVRSSDNATVGADIRLFIQSNFFTVASPDGISSAGLPFNNAAPAEILDSKTPTVPAVALDGKFSSNFEYLHFTWNSSVVQGSITGAFYAVGTSSYTQDILPFTAIAANATDVQAKGFALISGTTYFVMVKTQSSFGFFSPVGVSTHGVLMDFQTPPAPAPAISAGSDTLLITWATVPGGASGIMGYLIEYRHASSPIWYNAVTGEPSTAIGAAAAAIPSASVPNGFLGPQAMRTAAVSQSQVATGTSFQATTLPSGTLYIRVSAVTGSGVVGTPSQVTKVQLGALPKDGIGDASSYPNPFDSRKQEANIHYELSAAAEVSIKIFSVFGRAINTLSFPAGSNGGQAGSNTVTWDGTDDSGRKVSKGMYLAVIQSGGAKKILKIGVIH